MTCGEGWAESESTGWISGSKRGSALLASESGACSGVATLSLLLLACNGKRGYLGSQAFLNMPVIGMMMVRWQGEREQSNTAMQRKGGGSEGVCRLPPRCKASIRTRWSRGGGQELSALSMCGAPLVLRARCEKEGQLLPQIATKA